MFIGIEPQAAPQIAPAPGAHVHVPAVVPAGSASVTGAAVTEEGPALPTSIVYVTFVPGVADVAPSVFVIDRSARGAATDDAVSLLSDGSVRGLPPAVRPWRCWTGCR